ncbi:MAG: ABC transporter ATP-binding protein [Oscillospiraceae bacterium]|jgi:ABC-type nitrate/sulfonate/bicarbonate transport system ATPase subunit
MSLFRCEKINKSYQGQPVIEDISLHLAQGELVGLLGASGVGKTTLMSILAGVDCPDSGRVFLEDEDITGMAGRVGYMLQKDLLLPFKTTLDNVSLPLILKGMKKSQAREKAAEQMERFGLAGSEDKYPHQLSGGMRQRAALLRTHFLGNQVILLDEPFSALDALTKSELHRWYLDASAQMGLTTLFITHDIDEALTLSHRIYVMAGMPGQIKAELSISAPRPRPADFAFSQEFLQAKRQLLDAIGGQN